MDGKTTAPVLPNLPAYIECQVEQIVDTHGDHAVVILRVVEAECQERVRPLTMAATPWNYGGGSRLPNPPPPRHGPPKGNKERTSRPPAGGGSPRGNPPPTH